MINRFLDLIGEQNINVDHMINKSKGEYAYTMLDLEDCDRDYKLGDIVEFRPNYVVTMYATTSPNVKIKIVDEF